MTSAQKASEHNKGVGNHAPSQNLTLLKALFKQVLFLLILKEIKVFFLNTFHKVASILSAYFKISAFINLDSLKKLNLFLRALKIILKQ
jgi:hypothetical protein